MAAGDLYLGELFHLAGIKARFAQNMDHAGDGVQRRADFVAHVGEKGALGNAASLCGVFGNNQILGARFHQRLQPFTVGRKLGLNLLALRNVLNQPDGHPLALHVHGRQRKLNGKFLPILSQGGQLHAGTEKNSLTAGAKVFQAICHFIAVAGRNQKFV